MFPECLTEASFPLYVRARELLEQAIKCGPGGRRSGPLQYLDSLIVPALTAQGIELSRNQDFDRAEHVLVTAITIQQWLYHPTHEDLSNPLLALGDVYALQRRLREAETAYLRALGISAKSDARIEQHKKALVCLIDLLGRQERRHEEFQMRASLERLGRENPFVVKDRPNKPYE